jgi:hypothetical protein
MHRAPLCSVQQYLDKLRQSEHDTTNLLSYEAGQLRRNSHAKNSIFTPGRSLLITYETFDHLRPSYCP